jgi:hypothetical protein
MGEKTGCEWDGYETTGYMGEENINKIQGPVVKQGIRWIELIRIEGVI